MPLLHRSLILGERPENQHRLGGSLHGLPGCFAFGVARHQRYGKGFAVGEVFGRTIGKGGMKKVPLTVEIAVETDKDTDDPHPISTRIANQARQTLGRGCGLSWQETIPLGAEALLPQAGLSAEVFCLAVRAKQRNKLKRVARGMTAGAEQLKLPGTNKMPIDSHHRRG
jgi:hypothetical protein